MLSAIIPTYNAAPYLRVALDSVLDQTVHVLEVLLTRPSLAHRWGDRAKAWYRGAAQHAGEGRWAAATGLGLLALMAGPRYTLARLLRQRGPGHADG